MEYVYVDYNGITHSDILPVELESKKIFGGWTAFSCEMLDPMGVGIIQYPPVAITKIQY